MIACRGSLARGVDLTRDLSRVMLRILRHPASGVPIVLLSVINQVALGIVVFLIARALGADIGLGRTVTLFTPAMLLSMVPISFGGWGVREAAMMWLFSGAGIAPGTALSISIVFGLVTTAAGLLGGVFWLVDWLRPTHAGGVRGDTIGAASRDPAYPLCTHAGRFTLDERGRA